jgi:hypothetical protein
MTMGLETPHELLLGLQEQCRNSDEIIAAMRAHRPLPPFVLSTGLAIEHSACDPVL